MLASTVPGVGQTAVALVEEVNSKTADVELMDYVAAGKVITLEPQDTIALAYLKSCWREFITGGTVNVGTEQSEVHSGKIERSKVECDQGRLMLSAQEASQSAGMVFRDAPSRKQSPAPKPQITLYGLSPIIEIKSPGMLVIERIDQPGESYELPVTNSNASMKKGFYDLSQEGKALAPGGTYRAKLGRRQLIFKIHPEAMSGNSPILGRLLRLAPAS